MPITDRSGPDLGRRFKTAAFCSREFAVLGNSEVRKITERVKMLRAFPNRPHRIIGECQFRDRTCASDYLCKRMRSGAKQKSELTELLRPRVRFCTLRPSAAIVN